MRTIPINSHWKMKKTGQETYLPAVVPGSVLTDLLRADLIPDPFYGENEKEIKKIFDQSYEYECEFNVDQDFYHCSKKSIKFEGLDTLAVIYLNSKRLAQTNNMHCTYIFDVDEEIKAGSNQLRIVFNSPTKLIKEQQRRLPLWGVQMAVPGYPHIRKAHYMFGWDWGPQLIDAGIWRRITLAGYEAARINDLYISQQHHSQQVNLILSLLIEKINQRDQIQAEVSIYSPEKVCLTTQKAYLEKEHQFSLTIKNPRLWWPNGYGEQPLYQIKIKLYHENRLVDEDSKTIGLRTLTVNRDPDQWGENFALQVNGINIFAMGANYIPEDPILARTSPEKTEKLIRDCQEANFNCLRIWGGGIYPDDYFFDLCDQYGLVIWHDLMFACAQYNLTEEFTQSIQKEIEDNVKRIRHHACLGLWCGNNEMEWGWTEWDFPKSEKLKMDYLIQFEKIIPDLLARIDPETFYWPASPSSGGGFLDPNAEHSGDVHYWQVFHGKMPYQDYSTHYFRFASEFGMQSFPDRKTIAAYVQPDQQNIFSPIMEYHNKCMQRSNGNQTILFYVTAEFLMPKNLEMMIYASQIMQARAIACGVEHWRRNRGRCMGATYWQLNDSYAGPSWSSIDYYGRWKALHYFAKLFFNPNHLSVQFYDNCIRFYFLNESLKEQSALISYQLVHQDKGVQLEGSSRIDAQPLQSTGLTPIEIKKYLATDEQIRNTWLEYSLTNEKGKKQLFTLIFTPPKYFNFKKPEIKVNITGPNITLTSNVYAPYAELYVNGHDLKLENNFFDLIPGEAVSVRVIESTLPLTGLSGSLKLRTVYDIAGD